jgi:hypothetical protein
MHLSSKLLAIGAALFVIGIAGGAVKATRPVDRHMKVVLHVAPPVYLAATV